MATIIADTPSPKAASKSSRPLEVLIADDDEFLRDYLALEIAQLGCTVACVEDGAGALALLTRQHFDVLVTDWVMPGMDGMELVRALRGRGLTEEYLHIIMMTARGAEGSVRSALEAGVDDFLVKPVDKLQLELGIASARRVVDLQRRLKRRNRHLSAAHKRTREAYRRIKTDLDAATTLQRRLLPPAQLDGPLRYAWIMQPSLQIGGDTLGVVGVSGERHMFFHLDVSGHGIPAALGSFALHNRLTTLAPPTPEALLETAATLNAELGEQAGDSYCTMILGLADPASRKVWLIRAGHPIPLILRAGGTAEWVQGGGLPLALLPKAPQTLIELTLAPGDRIFLYSDGVTDAGEEQGRPLTEQGLFDFARSHAALPLDALLERLEDHLKQLRGGAAPEDDISVLALQI